MGKLYALCRVTFTKQRPPAGILRLRFLDRADAAMGFNHNAAYARPPWRVTAWGWMPVKPTREQDDADAHHREDREQSRKDE